MAETVDGPLAPDALQSSSRSNEAILLLATGIELRYVAPPLEVHAGAHVIDSTSPSRSTSTTTTTTTTPSFLTLSYESVYDCPAGYGVSPHLLSDGGYIGGGGGGGGGGVTCVQCAPGSYALSNKCTPCLAGTYTASKGATTCIPCAPGTHTTESGSSACPACQPGTYAATAGSTTCYLCGVGTFSAQTGSAACQTCVGPDLNSSFLGSFSNTTGSTCCQSPRTRVINRTDFARCTPAADKCPCLPGLLAPDCRRPVFWLEYSDTDAIIYQALSALFLLLACGTAAALLRHAHHPVVRGSNLTLCTVILLANTWGLCSAFVAIGQPTSGKCSLYAIMAATSFALLMCGLLFKTWRLHRIFVAPAKNGLLSGLSDRRLLFYTLTVVTMEVVVLAAVESAYPIGLGIDLVAFDAFGPRRLVCGPGLETQLVAALFNLVYLAVGSYLVFRTRKVSTTQFGESGFIILVLLFVGVVVPLIGLGLDLNGRARTLFQMTIVLATHAFALLMIFMPKLFGIWADEAFNGAGWSYNEARKKSSSGGAGASSNSTTVYTTSLDAKDEIDFWASGAWQAAGTSGVVAGAVDSSSSLRNGSIRDESLISRNESNSNITEESFISSSSFVQTPPQLSPLMEVQTSTNATAAATTTSNAANIDGDGGGGGCGGHGGYGGDGMSLSPSSAHHTAMMTSSSSLLSSQSPLRSSLSQTPFTPTAAMTHSDHYYDHDQYHHHRHMASTGSTNFALTPRGGPVNDHVGADMVGIEPGRAEVDEFCQQNMSLVCRLVRICRDYEVEGLATLLDRQLGAALHQITGIAQIQSAASAASASTAAVVDSMVSAPSEVIVSHGDGNDGSCRSGTTGSGSGAFMANTTTIADDNAASSSLSSPHLAASKVLSPPPQFSTSASFSPLPAVAVSTPVPLPTTTTTSGARKSRRRRHLIRMQSLPAPHLVDTQEQADVGVRTGGTNDGVSGGGDLTETLLESHLHRQHHDAGTIDTGEVGMRSRPMRRSSSLPKALRSVLSSSDAARFAFSSSSSNFSPPISQSMFLTPSSVVAAGTAGAEGPTQIPPPPTSRGDRFRALAKYKPHGQHSEHHVSLKLGDLVHNVCDAGPGELLVTVERTGERGLVPSALIARKKDMDSLKRLQTTMAGKRMRKRERRAAEAADADEGTGGRIVRLNGSSLDDTYAIGGGGGGTSGKVTGSRDGGEGKRIYRPRLRKQRSHDITTRQANIVSKVPRIVRSNTVSAGLDSCSGAAKESPV